jgi:hypothetical protein
VAWTTPKTWATNDSLGASTLNTHLRDNLNFLYGRPCCRVFNNANISHTTSGALQALTFNSERFDTDTMHSTSSQTGRITFTTAGYYMVGGQVEFGASATGERGLAIRLGGTTTLISHNQDAIGSDQLSVVTFYAFTAGQYVELLGYQTSGGALNMNFTSAYSPEFWAVFQGG